MFLVLVQATEWSIYTERKERDSDRRNMIKEFILGPFRGMNCTSKQNLYVEALNPNVTILGDKGFGR